MKRYVALLLACLSLLMLLAGCRQVEPVDSPELIPTRTIIADDVSLTVNDENQKVWLDNSHFASVEIKTGSNGITYLEFVTTEAGKSVLAEATAANLNKPLYFFAGHKLLFSPEVGRTIEDGVFVVSNDKAYDAQYFFNLLTGAENVLEGVRPPKYLIKDEEAQVIAFNKARVTPDQILDVSCSLQFDTDYSCWAYTVSFLVENVRHTCKIHAVTGAVINYSK